MKYSETYIAGWKTPDDWNALVPRLMTGGDQEAWEIAYNDYYLARLNMRYFSPIHILQQHGTLQGEGFSIVAIQCSLVEFLETTIQGTFYRFLRKGEVLQKYEYSKTGEVFESFLLRREPFRRHFNVVTAKQFYEYIRCGLLHEACTKAGWRIWAKSDGGKIIDETLKVIFRDDFQEAFDHFLEYYRADLFRSTTLKAAFIRKFNHLCVS